MCAYGRPTDGNTEATNKATTKSARHGSTLAARSLPSQVSPRGNLLLRVCLKVEPSIQCNTDSSNISASYLALICDISSVQGFQITTGAGSWLPGFAALGRDASARGKSPDQATYGAWPAGDT